MEDVSKEMMQEVLKEDKPFVPSENQKAIFGFVQDGKGNALVISVPGSGKTTTILRSFPYITPNKSVLYLVFNKKNEEEMKGKLVKLQNELGRSFDNVTVKTFHGYGFTALLKYYRSVGVQVKKPDTKKCKKLFREMYPNEEIQLKYSSFVVKLVAFAKGEGIGIIKDNEPESWHQIIDHQDMRLDNEEADVGKAITYAQQLLDESFYEAKKNGWIDFDDMLFMPLALDLTFWKYNFIFGDEMQDTNPVRRELIARSMNEWSRFIGVGDPMQAIYGFTGASNDAMDLLRERFDCIDLMLNVSFRCPKAIVDGVKKLVPYFEVADTNIEGRELFNVKFDEAMKILTQKDAILCRNVAPIVSLAFKIIASGRACHVLGSEIGKGLIKLVRQMDAADMPTLQQRIITWRDREVEALLAQEQEAKAEAIADKAECVLVMADSLTESNRTVEGLIAHIQNLFQDVSNTLCLSSMHKSKGLEWEDVAIYRPELMPSPWAKKPWQAKQELHLEVVARTRVTNTLIWMPEVK